MGHLEVILRHPIVNMRHLKAKMGHLKANLIQEVDQVVSPPKKEIKWSVTVYQNKAYGHPVFSNGHNLVIFQSILKNYRCFGISKTSSFQ